MNQSDHDEPYSADCPSDDEAAIDIDEDEIQEMAMDSLSLSPASLSEIDKQTHDAFSLLSWTPGADSHLRVYTGDSRTTKWRQQTAARSLDAIAKQHSQPITNFFAREPPKPPSPIKPHPEPQQSIIRNKFFQSMPAAMSHLHKHMQKHKSKWSVANYVRHHAVYQV